MSRFPASKAVAFLDALLSFFLGESFNSDGVDIHGIWVRLGGLVVSLNGVGVVGFFVGNGIGSVPLGFKVDGSGVPVFDLGRDRVHAIDSFHERGWDSPSKEIDEGIFMVDFTKCNIIFELRDVVS